MKNQNADILVSYGEGALKMVLKKPVCNIKNLFDHCILLRAFKDIASLTAYYPGYIPSILPMNVVLSVHSHALYLVHTYFSVSYFS